MSQITIIGDITLDLISSLLKSLPKEDTETFTQFTPKIGGQAAHCALGLAQLGIKTKFFACLGKDPLAELIIKKLSSQKNLQLSFQRKNHPALSLIALTKHKRTILNDSGANALFQKINLKQINTPYLFIGGIWHLKKLNIIHILKYAQSKNITTFVDLGWNSKPDYKKLNIIFNYSDYLFLNKKELLLFTKQKSISSALNKIKNTNVALHLGTQGSALYSQNKTTKAPIKKIYRLDTTGAGDFWNAAFIYGIIKKQPTKKILQFANQFAIKYIKEKLHNL